MFLVLFNGGSNVKGSFNAFICSYYATYCLLVVCTDAIEPQAGCAGARMVHGLMAWRGFGCDISHHGVSQVYEKGETGLNQ
jgi:hypothetical protein